MKKMFTQILIVIFTAILCCGSGYKGSLPDINKQFESYRTISNDTKRIYKPFDESKGEPKYKKIPRENKTYIDIILKKDKTSPYLNDMNDVLTILEKMKKCIENKGNTQKFNAIASSIIDHADYMAEKYSDKPERYYIGFTKFQDLSNQVREIATLLCESQVYVKYLTYQGSGQVYSQENIDKQISIFKQDLDNTIKIIKDSK